MKFDSTFLISKTPKLKKTLQVLALVFILATIIIAGYEKPGEKYFSITLAILSIIGFISSLFIKQKLIGRLKIENSLIRIFLKEKTISIESQDIKNIHVSEGGYKDQQRESYRFGAYYMSGHENIIKIYTEQDIFHLQLYLLNKKELEELKNVRKFRRFIINSSQHVA